MRRAGGNIELCWHWQGGQIHSMHDYMVTVRRALFVFSFLPEPNIHIVNLGHLERGTLPPFFFWPYIHSHSSNGISQGHELFCDKLIAEKWLTFIHSFCTNLDTKQTAILSIKDTNFIVALCNVFLVWPAIGIGIGTVPNIPNSFCFDDHFTILS
jgi:hypothetical protein